MARAKALLSSSSAAFGLTSFSPCQKKKNGAKKLKIKN
jgi:hypothetical protein